MTFLGASSRCEEAQEVGTPLAFVGVLKQQKIDEIKVKAIR